MKQFLKRALSLALCGLTVLSMSLLPIAAGEPEGSTEQKPIHELRGNELLKAYNFKCTTEDNEDGTNPSIKDAEIVSLDNKNAFLKVTFPKNDANKYPGIIPNDIPVGLTNYTVKADFITVIDDGNKLSYITYGTFSFSNKKGTGNFGLRTGSDGTLECQNVVTPTGDKPALGKAEELKELSPATNGVTHTLEAIVVSENGALTVTLKVDGVKVENLQLVAGAELKECGVSLRAWHGFAYGFDNISVVDNTTGEAVFSEDFEDHSLANEKTYVDENTHGYACKCGVAQSENHNFVEVGEVDDENSCTTKKAKKMKCDGCNHETTVSNPHTPGEAVVKDATCLEDGLRTVTCTVCNEEIEREVLKTNGHDFGLWEKTETGKKRTCDTCGEIEEIHTTTKPATTDPVAAPETDPTTNDNEQEKGCGAIVALPAVLFTVAGAVVLTVRKKKED